MKYHLIKTDGGGISGDPASELLFVFSSIDKARLFLSAKKAGKDTGHLSKNDLLEVLGKERRVILDPDPGAISWENSIVNIKDLQD